jgi:hypothetical protein
MVDEGSGVRGQGSEAGGQESGVRGRKRRVTGAAYLVAICAVLPLVVPGVWTGFRLAVSDPVLSVISSAEQPLSVRTAGGVWAIALALAWFSLGYWHRRVTFWEAALVLVGGGVALARLGNTWADAALILVPLGRQLALARCRPWALASVAATGLVAAALTLVVSRPPELPAGAAQSVAASQVRGKVLADWRWAADVQRRLGADRLVLASGGIASESSDFWLDYVRIARGHEHWAAALVRLEVNLVVLEAADQQRPTADLVRASADWRVLYDANNALVATRVGL